jgi:iron complex outermembrane recepter protein
MKNYLFSCLLVIISLSAFSQNRIAGTILNSEGKAIQDVIVKVQGENQESKSDANGKFELTTKVSTGKIMLFSENYDFQLIPFDMNGNSLINIGEVRLETAIQNISEVKITAKGIIDLEEDRKTPIASTTITSAEIQEKAGNSDLPELLKSTPSVQNVRGGGFGDGSMFLRGFDQTNTAFLLNGQPINGMEDGKMYWSNWSGILDVANAIQVQRGLGSSKLAISSVGGTTNILMKTVDSKKGGFSSIMVANNNYLKTTAYVSTGLSAKGWAFSAMLSHWQGNGYVSNTQGQGQSYFFSVGYKPSEKHVFNFLITGAPQWHAAAGTQTLKDFLTNDIRYNSWSSNINNEKYPGGRNFYHKPVANLTWDWTISNKTSLSSVLYGSSGRGGFASVISSGGVDQYARGSYNNHNWGGLISNLSQKLGDHLNLNVGLDARFYKGIHFRGVTDFFAADSVKSTNALNGEYYVTNNYGGYDPWLAVFKPNTDGLQHLGYDYSENINYQGLFGQLEYAVEKFSAYFQGAVSNQSHVKTDNWNYAQAEKSDKVNNAGYNAKGGVAYAFAKSQKVFANAGYYSRQPFHDELFRNIRTGNDLIDPQVGNQEITGLEFGYQLKTKSVKVNLNLYNTIWANRTLSSDNGETDPTKVIYYQAQGVRQNHKGIELEMQYQASNRLMLRGFWSVGDWQYEGNATVKAFDDAGNDVSSTLPNTELKLDGVRVGGAAQSTAGAALKFNIFKGFSYDANLNWFNGLYSNVGASEHTIVLPHYQTVDMGVSYRIPTQKNESFQIRFNVNNLLDKKFIESSSTAIDFVDAASSWQGVNVNNKVRFGYGRTWNLSVRYNF